MAHDRRRARHRAPVVIRPGAEAARYLLEERSRTRALLAMSVFPLPLVAAWVAPAPPRAYAGICLMLAVLQVLCAMTQRVRVTVGYGTLLSAMVLVVGREVGVPWLGCFITAGTMLLLTGAAAGASRVWVVAHDVLAEQLRVTNAALKRANDRLREANASLEQRVAERTDELRELSRRDELTGLYNRRHFMEHLTQAGRSQDGFSVLMIDADNFKAVNDTSGHAAGDQVLQTLATTMLRTTRSVDLLARIGGEEFAVLVPDADGTSGPLLAERIRASVEAVAWPEELHLPSGRVTVSIGFANTSGPGTAPAALLQLADAALYASKQAGRNCVSGVTDLR